MKSTDPCAYNYGKRGCLQTRQRHKTGTFNHDFVNPRRKQSATVFGLLRRVRLTFRGDGLVVQGERVNDIEVFVPEAVVAALKPGALVKVEKGRSVEIDTVQVLDDDGRIHIGPVPR